MNPVLISTKQELFQNLLTVETYLNAEASMIDAEIMSGYIQRGHNFVAYKVGETYHFAPSKFIGYKNNSLSKHEALLKNKEKCKRIDGGKTDDSINSLLYICQFDQNLEEAYLSYCRLLAIQPHLKRKRKYWVLKEDIVTSSGIITYEEGDVRVREHLVRERNQKVVAEAKKLFIQKHGHVFCEACGFDFSKVYGTHGQNYIQAHHKVPLALHDKKHKIAPTEFVMLCANCHCMIHRPENGEMITVEKLIELVNRQQS